jgi:uncharacterized membrane protein YheB (UPF0754 family)
VGSSLYVYLTVPLVAAFVGWVTNWLAVVMIFSPEKYRGLGPIGWQGVLPRRATKFATGVAEIITSRLISPREMAERLDPAEMEKLFAATVEAESRHLVAEAAEIVQPGLWEKLPPEMQEAFVVEIQKRVSAFAHDLFGELRGLSPELLDLKALIVSKLSGEETRRLSRLFRHVGGKELKFIEYYGGVFGFLIGLLQAASWSLFGLWWTMPIVGVVVGLITNWLAIQMIFRPQEPTRYLGLVTYQGMFARRQAEIARDYGRLAAAEVLTPRNLIRLVTDGEAGERMARLVTEAIFARVDHEWKTLAPLLPAEVTPEKLGAIKTRIVARLVEKVPELQPELERYLEQKLDIANTIEQKLASLPKAEFERVLRGIFEEDELILIVIGGVLGGAVGLLQGLITLSGLGVG